MTFEVTLLPSGTTFLVEADETVVDGLRRHGLRTRYKCRRGGCGVCRATLVSGEITYPSGVCVAVLEEDREASEAGPDQGACLPCRAVPVSDLVIELGPHDSVVDVLGAVASGTAKRLEVDATARDHD